MTPRQFRAQKNIWRKRKRRLYTQQLFLENPPPGGDIQEGVLLRQ